MSNKTPYEVRLDILTLAKQYMDNNQLLENQVANTAFSHALAEDEATADDWELYAPKQYTPEELIEVAQKLYDFVLTK